MTVGALVDGLKRRAAKLPMALNLPVSLNLHLRGFARHAAVVQSLPIGPGSRLLVVEFGGRRLLVGQSRAGLATLAEAAPETLAQ